MIEGARRRATGTRRVAEVTGSQTVIENKAKTLGAQSETERLAAEGDLAQAQWRAGELLAVISQPYRLAGRDFFVTCSIGLAVTPDHAGNFDDLLQKADAAMYVAKAGGKNGLRLWEPSISHESSRIFGLIRKETNALRPLDLSC